MYICMYVCVCIYILYYKIRMSTIILHIYAIKNLNPYKMFYIYSSFQKKKESYHIIKF